MLITAYVSASVSSVSFAISLKDSTQFRFPSQHLACELSGFCQCERLWEKKKKETFLKESF